MRQFVLLNGSLRIAVYSGKRWLANFYFHASNQKTYGSSSGHSRRELFKNLRLAIAMKLDPRIKAATERVARLPTRGGR